PCEKANETAGCRTGRICLDTHTPRVVPKKAETAPSDAGAPEPCDKDQCYCFDAPRLDDPGASVGTCLGELTAYQVGVGRGFAVAGSQVGIPATGAVAANGHCGRMPGLDPRLTNRISVDAPLCDPDDVPQNNLDSRCNPNLSDPGCPMVSNVTT